MSGRCPRKTCARNPSASTWPRHTCVNSRHVLLGAGAWEAWLCGPRLAWLPKASASPEVSLPGWLFPEWEQVRCTASAQPQTARFSLEVSRGSYCLQRAAC